MARIRLTMTDGKCYMATKIIFLQIWHCLGQTTHNKFNMFVNSTGARTRRNTEIGFQTGSGMGTGSSSINTP